MNTALRLGLFGVGLVAIFGVAAAAADALVPDGVVTAWMQSSEQPAMQDHPSDDDH